MKWWSFLLCLFVCLRLQAQEVCNNGLDDDNDGKIDLQDEDCSCSGRFVNLIPQSLIYNHSFEEHSCCPEGFSQIYCANGWPQPSGGTPDYIHQCSNFNADARNPRVPKMPFPVPEGSGAVGIINGLDVTGPYKEYIATLLLKPLEANQEYILDFSVGFGFDSSKLPPLELTVFGHPSLTALPWSLRPVCPPTFDHKWIPLGTIKVGGSNEWVKSSLSFTPGMTVNSLAIGPPCEPQATDSVQYYYLDNLVLYKKEDANQLWINTAASEPCENKVTLSVNTDDAFANFKWFRDGVAITSSKSKTLILSHGSADDGTYRLMGYKDDVCQLSSDYTYAYVPKPSVKVDLGPDIEACLGRTVTLKSPTEDVNYYYWSNGATAKETQVTQPGQYSIEVVVGRCRSRDTINVAFSKFPKIDIGPGKYICADEPITIGRDSAGSSHKWSTGETTPNITVNRPGAFTDSVTVNGCTMIGKVDIIKNPLIVDLGPDKEACLGKPVIIAPGLPKGTSYLWNKISSDSSYYSEKSETIVLEADLEGCEKKDTLSVHFNQSPSVSLGQDTSVCKGSAFFLDATTPGCAYRWNTGSADAKIFPQIEGRYKVRVSNVNNCYADDSIAVRFIEKPKLNVGKDIAICKGDTLELIPGSEYAESFMWNDGVASAGRLFSSPGIFSLKATNNCGSTTDDIVILDGGKCAVSFPNAFTPNNDGVNDEFHCNGVYNIKNFFLHVYNRWGQLIFSAKDPSSGWNGTINGKQAPAGNYIWKAGWFTKTSDIMKFESGSLLLIR